MREDIVMDYIYMCVRLELENNIDDKFSNLFSESKPAAYE